MKQLPPERKHLVEENIGLAYYFARKHSSLEEFSAMSVEDREGEALLALVEAARTWDDTKAPFPAYASKTIKNRLIQATRNETVPFNLTWKSHTILRDMKRAVANGTPDNPQSISDALNINISKVIELWSYHKGAKVPMPEDIDQRIAAQSTSVENAVDKLMTDDIVRHAVNALPPKHRRLIRYRFGFITGEPMLSSEIRKEMGLRKGEYLAMEAAALRALQKILASLKDTE